VITKRKGTRMITDPRLSRLKTRPSPADHANPRGLLVAETGTGPALPVSARPGGADRMAPGRVASKEELPGHATGSAFLPLDAVVMALATLGWADVSIAVEIIEIQPGSGGRR
jgi:hypothetical protein